MAYDIAVHLPQQSVHMLADSLMLLYYCVPQHFQALLSQALQPYTVPPQSRHDQSVTSPQNAPLDAAAIQRFASQFSQLTESVANTPANRVKVVGRSARELGDAFAYACRQQAHP